MWKNKNEGIKGDAFAKEIVTQKEGESGLTQKVEHEQSNGGDTH